MNVTYRDFEIRTVKYDDAPGYAAEIRQPNAASFYGWDQVAEGETKEEAVSNAKARIDLEYES